MGDKFLIFDIYFLAECIAFIFFQDDAMHFFHTVNLLCIYYFQKNYARCKLWILPIITGVTYLMTT